MMLNNAKPLRFALLFITLLLLMLLVFQLARLFWHVTNQQQMVVAPELVSEQRQNNLAWLAFTQSATDGHNAHIAGNSSSIAQSSSLGSWVLKGIYSEFGDSVAIIQTPQKSYVVEEGEGVEDGYTVVRISPDSVKLQKSGQSGQILRLDDNHLASLAANTEGGELLAAPNVQRPKSLGIVPKEQFQQQADIFNHVNFTPKVIDGKPALQLSAKSTTGFTQLRRFGLRQGDILLSIDGYEPSPEMWRVVAAKWRAAQKITAKVKRHRNIETITIENK